MADAVDPLELLAAADAARTPGTWRWWDGSELRAEEDGDSVIVGEPIVGGYDGQEWDIGEADAVFIATCGTYVPALLAELRALRAQNKRLAEIENLHEQAQLVISDLHLKIRELAQARKHHKAEVQAMHAIAKAVEGLDGNRDALVDPNWRSDVDAKALRDVREALAAWKAVRNEGAT